MKYNFCLSNRTLDGMLSTGSLVPPSTQLPQVCVILVRQSWEREAASARPTCLAQKLNKTNLVDSSPKPDAPITTHHFYNKD